MKVVNDYSELPGAGSGSEVGKGVTFQTIAAEQAVGGMVAFNAAGHVGSDGVVFKSVENQPRGIFTDGKGGVDFRIEHYAAEGVLSDKASQDKVALAVEQRPFYGVIPSGFSGFGERVGEILVSENNDLRVCNRSDVPNLGNYVELPSGWERVAEIVNF